MGQAILFDGILERACDVRLAHQIVERLGPVFPRKNLIAHPTTLSRPQVRERRKAIDRGFQRFFLLSSAHKIVKSLRHQGYLHGNEEFSPM